MLCDHEIQKQKSDKLQWDPEAPEMINSMHNYRTQQQSKHFAPG